MDVETLLNSWLQNIGIKHGKNLLDELKGQPAAVVTGTLTDIADLRVREMAGEDITPELSFAESTLKDMTVAVEIKTLRTILDVLIDSAEMAGSILLGLLKKV